MIPSVDIGTLYVSATVVAAFFGCAFLGFHFIESETRGLLQWGFGYLAVALGLTITLFRAVVPLFVYGPLASMLFVLAAVLLDVGTRNADESPVPWLDAAVPAAALLMLLVFAYASPAPEVRLLTLFVAVSLGTSSTSIRLIRHARAAESGTRTALVTFSVFYTVLAASMISLVVITLVVGPIDGVLVPHPLHVVLLPALMLFFIGAGMSKLWVHYMHAYAEARLVATTDPLTGVRNRRYVLPELERLFQRSQREGRRLACMMLDADSFKSINDSYGHRKGDEVLVLLAQRLTAAVRDYDLVGRYGGEEFIIVVPELDREMVTRMAARIHQSVRATPLAGLRLSISVGVAFLSNGDARADDLVHRADQALYRAKRAGRDQVAVDDGPPEPPQPVPKPIVREFP